MTAIPFVRESSSAGGGHVISAAFGAGIRHAATPTI